MLLLIKVKVGVNLHTIAGRVEKMGKLHVNVKFSSASSCPLEVDSSSSVRSLKNCVSSKTGIAEGDLHLILAGKVLNDNQTLDVSYWQLILYPPPPRTHQSTLYPWDTLLFLWCSQLHFLKNLSFTYVYNPNLLYS